MSPEYEALFKEPIRLRIIEKRTRLLESWVASLSLARLLSVQCVPLVGCEPKRCFVNVDRQMAKSGGSMETGWIFNEYEKRAIEAEAHAVWIDPTGKRLDITPHEFQPKRVLFAPDSRVAEKRGYTAGPVKVLSDDPRIQSIYAFDAELNRMRESKFSGFGKEMVYEECEIAAALMVSGLPREVGKYMLQVRIDANRRAWAEYGGEC